jgi:hypothetical protein
MRLWQLTSATGRATECRIARTECGDHQLLILHGGKVAATEVYVSRAHARMRALEIGRALRTRGWSQSP